MILTRLASASSTSSSRGGGLTAGSKNSYAEMAKRLTAKSGAGARMRQERGHVNQYMLLCFPINLCLHFHLCGCGCCPHSCYERR